MDQLNIDSNTIFLAGDASILDDASLYLIRVNLHYLEEAVPDIDLYAEVREGKWTIDRLYELAVASARDLDQDGILTEGKDRLGYAAPAHASFAHVAACGVTLSNFYSSGETEIPEEPKAELLNAWAALGKLLSSPSRSFNEKGILSLRAIFSCDQVASLLATESVLFPADVLPMPKLNEEQVAYVTTASFADLCTYAIPKTVDHLLAAIDNGFASGTEQASYFFEIFSYYSMKTLTPAFYTRLYESEFLQTEESREMLVYAMQNRIYDPAVGYNFGGINVFESMDKKGTRDQLQTLYRSHAPAARKALSLYRGYISDDQL